jgi:iron complex transport system substrate-binding protein
MKFKGLKSLLLIISATAIAITAAGCSAQKTDTPATASPSQEATSPETTTYPVRISHAFGETVVEQKPERVVTISWGNQDVPLALGVVPVGVSEANYGVLDGSGLLPWTAERIQELGAEHPIIFSDTDGLDFEAINAAQPDVILAAYSGITQEEYDTLSEIAPTVAYPRQPWQTLWREQILIDAKGMGLEAEGKQLVSDLEAIIAETVGKYPQIEGMTAAFLYFDPTDLSKLSIYSPGDPRCAFLADLGLQVPDSVTKLAEGSESFYITVSAENADQLKDVDIILTYALADGLLETLQADPLLGSIPAIKNGSVVVFKEDPLAASGTPSALSIPWAVNDYVSAIADAADKVK